MYGRPHRLTQVLDPPAVEACLGRRNSSCKAKRSQTATGQADGTRPGTSDVVSSLQDLVGAWERTMAG